jgi:small subunit ribosomal protein S16
MPVVIRLARHGMKNTPFYRIVAADHRRAPQKKFIEMVGTYDPLPSKHGTKEVRLNTDRIKYWLSVGAQPSARVHEILSRFEILPPRPFKQANMNSSYNPWKNGEDQIPTPPAFGPRDYWDRGHEYKIRSDDPTEYNPPKMWLGYPKEPKKGTFAKGGRLQEDAQFAAINESEEEDDVEGAQGWAFGGGGNQDGDGDFGRAPGREESDDDNSD